MREIKQEVLSMSLENCFWMRKLSSKMWDGSLPPVEKILEIILVVVVVVVVESDLKRN